MLTHVLEGQGVIQLFTYIMGELMVIYAMLIIVLRGQVAIQAMLYLLLDMLGVFIIVYGQYKALNWPGVGVFM